MANQDFDTPDRTTNRPLNSSRRLAEEDNLRASRRIEQDQIERENAALSAGGVFATILFLVVIGVGIYMFLTPVETGPVAVPASVTVPATNNMQTNTTTTLPVAPDANNPQPMTNSNTNAPTTNSTPATSSAPATTTNGNTSNTLP